MKLITSRKDISILVHAFYGKVRNNNTLGPVFNSHIKENDWPIHLDKLTDFWETNLFGIPKFKGSPSQKHAKVDAHMNHTISPSHFDTWLGLWFETIDELFEGELANKAKQSATKMATGQFLTIWNNRPDHLKE